jgi:hypothetical protein
MRFKEGSSMIKPRTLQSVILGAVLLVVATAPALRASPTADRLAGHWEAKMAGEGQTFTFGFDFKPNGDVLTGTVGLTSQDRTFEIKEGKIKGNAISFVGFGIWTGTLNGDELSLTRELDGGKKQTMKAHRIN